MKKFIMALASAIVLFQNSVKAQDDKAGVRGVLGIEVSVNRAQLSDGYDSIVADTLASVTVSAGAKVADAFSLTAFMQKSAEQEQTYGPLSTTASFYAAGMDFTGHVSVTENFDFLLGLGFGYYNFKLDSNFLYLSGTEDHVGLRIGAGVEYRLNDSVALTGMVRYIAFDYDEYVDAVENMAEASVGLKFYF